MNEKIHETPRIPYELLAEHIAEYEARNLLQQFDADPARIIRSLQDILKASMLEGIHIGLGLADVQDEVAEPADLMTAYLTGYNDNKQNGAN